MKADEILELAARGTYLEAPLQAAVEETHISWVLLTEHWAFKIKKPLKLSFLDFSTLALRKFYCQQELALNRRLSEIYQQVLPIYSQQEHWRVGEGGEGAPVEYAVQMKRLPAACRMDRVLRQEGVTAADMAALAQLLARFHRKAVQVHTPFVVARAHETFRDIYQIKDSVQEQFGVAARKGLDQAIRFSRNFLSQHEPHLQQRIRRGWKRDVHGDLHSANIFLCPGPVVFDCVEFNAEFRQIDLLDELAFLCMDLESHGQPALATSFLREYRKEHDCFEEKEDESLFLYYKCLRANIRAKVHAIGAKQAQQAAEKEKHLAETRKYLSLMQQYLNALKVGVSPLV